MAATNTTVQLVAGTWTQLTTADVTALRVQNVNGYNIRVMATAGATPPTTLDGSIVLAPLMVWATDLTLAQAFPGVTGTRVYGYCDNPARVSVSHA